MPGKGRRYLMSESKPQKVKIRFPGDLEYIPAVRKFVAELLLVNQFSSKCAYRSEIIIDEICNNAVVYGCRTADSQVEVVCVMHEDRIEFQVKDAGGSETDLKRLRDAVAAEESGVKPILDGRKSAAGLGLEIVRLLSEEVNVEVDDNNLTSIRVIRRREDAGTCGEKKAV